MQLFLLPWAAEEGLRNVDCSCKSQYFIINCIVQELEIWEIPYIPSNIQNEFLKLSMNGFPTCWLSNTVIWELTHVVESENNLP